MTDMTVPARYTRTLLLSAGLALGTAAAQASTFTWDFDGKIGAPTGATSPSFVNSGADTSTLTWGDPNDPVPNLPVNALTIGASGGTESFTDGQSKEIRIGSLSYTNMSVFSAGGVWNAALSFNLLVNSVAFSPILNIEVDNTPDLTPFTSDEANLQWNNTTGLNADVITFLDLPSLDFGTPINLGSGLWLDGYTVKLADAGAEGTRPDGYTGPVCSFGGFGSQINGASWSNCEGNTSVLGLYATIRYDAPDEPPAPVAPIPLPAAGWLLLGGLAGLGALRARRKTAA
jgi:hypothetical protein